jgi:hypothetical protein
MHEKEEARSFGAHDTAVRALVWLGLAGLMVGCLSTSRAIDTDVFHQMALFREALARGALPRGDVFAYAGTLETVIHHEWGTGAILYGVYEASGWGTAGVSALRYAIVIAVAMLAWRCARQRGASDAVAAMLAPLAIFLVVIAFLSPVRAQAFTVLFAATLLVLLELDRRGARWWIPVWLALHVVWVNVHGGAVVAFAIVGGAGLERVLRGLGEGRPALAALRSAAHLGAVIAAMALLALVLNPYGWEYAPYLWRAIRMHRPSIIEWAPLWDGRIDRAILVGYLLSLSIAAYAVWRAGVRAAVSVGGWTFLVLAAAAALLSTRHLSLYALAWFTCTSPLLAHTPMGELMVDAWNGRRAAIALVAAALLVVGAWAGVARRAWAVTIPDNPGAGELRWYPVAAVDYLALAGFTGRLLTQFQDGAYVSWRLHPAVKVSFDSRYEAAYVPGTLERHARLFDAGPGWESILEQDAADAILVPRTSPLAAALDRAGTGWVPVHRDGADSVYLRVRLGAMAPAATRSAAAAE